MAKEFTGLDDSTIIGSVIKNKNDILKFSVSRDKPNKNRGYTIVPITLSGSKKEYKLIEKTFSRNEKELFMFELISQYSSLLAEVYHIDFRRKIILMEDLNDGYFPGFHFNDENEYGITFRKNHKSILGSIAQFHALFWENYEVFSKIGLDKRLESKENLTGFINAMENDFIKYSKNEKTGKVPKIWNGLENNIELNKLDYFPKAIELLNQEYIKYIDTRYNSGKNITIIHGDLHPGNIFVSKRSGKSIKFIDLEAVRMGICTEDLAMFLALHVEPDVKSAKPLLKHYYSCLCETVKDYSYDNFMNDYKISVMENMFYPMKLMNRGIYDFDMRDRAIKTFETMIL